MGGGDVAALHRREELVVDGGVVLAVGLGGGLGDLGDLRVVQRLDGGARGLGVVDALLPLALVARVAGGDVERLRGLLLARAGGLLGGAVDGGLPAIARS